MGVELYLANKLTIKAIYGIVQFVRYMSAPITLRYDTFGPRISSSSSNDQKGSFFTSSDRTTIRVLK
jgi:hypothetical protein